MAETLAQAHEVVHIAFGTVGTAAGGATPSPQPSYARYDLPGERICADAFAELYELAQGGVTLVLAKFLPPSDAEPESGFEVRTVGEPRVECLGDADLANFRKQRDRAAHSSGDGGVAHGDAVRLNLTRRALSRRAVAARRPAHGDSKPPSQLASSPKSIRSVIGSGAKSVRDSRRSSPGKSSL